MNRSLTIAIIGAGSSYTPELIDGILKLDPEQIPVRQIRLFDSSPERLSVMGGLTERMIRRSGRRVSVESVSLLDQAIAGADFIITQIRVGGMPARFLDESIPLKYGILGQETTGPGGMFKALRTIPAMLEIARAVERLAPRAFILNYTNPSGLITEAVTRHTGARIIGLCSGIPSMIEDLRQQFATEFPDLSCRCVGLNHLGFIHRMESRGQDVKQEILRRLLDRTRAESADAEAVAWQELCHDLGALPISYLNYYFRRAHFVEKLKAQEQTRAQLIMDIEREVFAEAAAPDADHKPKALEKRGGGGYSAVTFAVMDAIHNDTGAEIAVNVPNCGAVDGINPEEIVEVVCRVDRHGAQPLAVGPIPLAFRGLVQAVKAYEVLTVEAAVTEDRRLLKHALINHPLVGDVDIIDPLIDEMLVAHRELSNGQKGPEHA